jgi:S1-C subfamily serine protease
LATGLTELAAFLSASAASRVAATALRVAAIRLGTRRHLCATLWSPEIAVTSSPLLPQQESYLLLFDQTHAVARLAWRDKATGLAGLRLEIPQSLSICPPPDPIQAGVWLVSVGIDPAGVPMAGIAATQPLRGSSSEEAAFGIDRDPAPGDFGGPLIAPSGALAGILGHRGSAGVIVPNAQVALLVLQPEAAAAATLEPGAPSKAGRTLKASAIDIGRAAPGRAKAAQPGRGWLGVALQPSIVPRGMFALAGQASGRKVVEIVPGGPADRAGLVSGDVVLTIANQAMTGSGSMREFLRHAQVGETTEIRLLRGTELLRVKITVSAAPGG